MTTLFRNRKVSIAFHLISIFFAISALASSSRAYESKSEDAPTFNYQQAEDQLMCNLNYDDDYAAAADDDDDNGAYNDEDDGVQQLSDLDSFWRTNFLDEIFKNKIADYIGQDDHDPPDEQLLNDLFSASANKREARVAPKGERDAIVVTGGKASGKTSQQMEIGGTKSKGVASYLKRSICNYIKRKELKFNYLKGLYHEHLNHQSHLDLLSSTTRAELLSRKNKLSRSISGNGNVRGRGKDKKRPLLLLEKQSEPVHKAVDIKDLKIYIYGKSNLSIKPMYKLEPLTKDKELIKKIPINMADKKVAVSVHGIWNDLFVDNQQQLKNALLNHYDYVLLFDWSLYADLWEYFSATESTMKIGALLGAFLNELITLKDLSTDNLHLFGYSLGAHIVAFTSRNIKSLRPLGTRIVNKITAFDPALPMFRSKGIEKSDARTVTVIHTDAGTLGQVKPAGHYDFYPSGGSNQPGCGKSMIDIVGEALDIYTACSHGRAITLFTDTISQRMGNQTNLCEYVGYPCETYAQYLGGKCTECMITNDKTQECLHLSLMNHRDKHQPTVKELQKLYFLGGPSDNLCMANYVVKIHFEKVLRQVKRTKGEIEPQPIEVAIRLEDDCDAFVGMIFIVGPFDKTASQILALNKTIKIKRLIIMSNKTAKNVEMFEINYLSHSKKSIRDQYSSTLRYDSVSTENTKGGQVFTLTNE